VYFVDNYINAPHYKFSENDVTGRNGVWDHGCYHWVIILFRYSSLYSKSLKTKKKPKKTLKPKKQVFPALR